MLWDNILSHNNERKIMEIILLGIGFFAIIMIGILGCMASIEDYEYRQFKERYDDDL